MRPRFQVPCTPLSFSLPHKHEQHLKLFLPTALAVAADLVFSYQLLSSSSDTVCAFYSLILTRKLSFTKPPLPQVFSRQVPSRHWYSASSPSLPSPRDETQGLVYTKQALCPLSWILSPILGPTP